MTTKELEKFLAQANDTYCQSSHVGEARDSKEHRECAAATDKAMREMRERKAKEARRWMKAQDVSRETKMSISVAYRIIRELAQELREKGYLTNRGFISRAYLYKRYYCNDEPHPFMDIEDIMDALPVSRSEGYVVIRKLNQAVAEKGCRTLRGRTSRRIFREKILGYEVADAG